MISGAEPVALEETGGVEGGEGWPEEAPGTARMRQLKRTEEPRWVIADERTRVLILREAWLRSGLTRAEMAQRCGMHVANLNKYFHRPGASQAKVPSAAVFLRILTVCGMRVVVEDVRGE